LPEVHRKILEYSKKLRGTNFSANQITKWIILIWFWKQNFLIFWKLCYFFEWLGLLEIIIGFLIIFCKIFHIFLVSAAQNKHDGENKRNLKRLKKFKQKQKKNIWTKSTKKIKSRKRKFLKMFFLLLRLHK